jgi:hypothetical protein
MSRLIDFDAFRAEQSEEPLIVRIGGQEYRLPASPPALVALDVMRRMETSEAKKIRFLPHEVPALAESIFGPEMLAELTGRHRLTSSELTVLLERVMTSYTEDAMPPPNRQTRRRAASPRSRSISSRPGRSSRPTSSASMASTSAPASAP